MPNFEIVDEEMIRIAEINEVYYKMIMAEQPSPIIHITKKGVKFELIRASISFLIPLSNLEVESRKNADQNM